MLRWSPVLLLVSVSCSGTMTPCKQGDTRECVGPGACRGGQQCRDDGSGWQACDCGAQGGSGGGGGGGSVGGGGGGSVGGGGATGSGGGGGNGFCGAFTDVIEACVLGADGGVLLETVSADVTVLSATTAASGGCSPLDGVLQAGLMSRHVTFESATQQRWTAVLRVPTLASNAFAPGQTFHLDVQGHAETATPTTLIWPHQSFAISDGGTPLVFGGRSRVGGLALMSWGIQYSRGALSCSEPPSFPCTGRRYLTDLQIGTAQVSVPIAVPTAVGPYTVTVEDSSLPDGLMCEDVGNFYVAGVRP